MRSRKITLETKSSLANISNNSQVYQHPISMLSLESIITWSAIYIIVGIFVIFFNTLVMLSFFKNKSLRTRTNYFIASLAWADFLVGAVSIPGWLALVLTTYYGNTFYQLLIQIWTAFDMLAGIGSIFHLMALSWDRFCAIVWPLRHRLYTRRKYMFILCMVWGFSVLVSGLSVIGNKNNPKAYNISVIVLCFFIPLLVILVAQGTIFYKIRQTRLSGEQCSISNIKREVRAAKAISIMILLFVIGWLPFFVIALMSYMYKIEYPAHAVLAVKFLQYSNSLFNPILYAQKFPKFRRAYVAMVCGCFRTKKKQYNHTFNPSCTYRSGTYRSVSVQSPQVQQKPRKINVGGSFLMASSSLTKEHRKPGECVRLQPIVYSANQLTVGRVTLNINEETTDDDGINDATE